MTKFFDSGPPTFSDQVVEVHAYEAASPFTSPVPSILGATSFHKCHHSTHSRFHWLGGINVGGSAHVGEEQLMAIKRIGILPVAAMFRASTP